MRNSFISSLCEIASENDKVSLIVGDLGYGVVEPFAEAFPDRFFNAGVAEQNMMGFAAGMASEGYHVFVYSIANFPIFRCAEQIRNDVDYHNLPVTIVSVGGGLAYGNLGYSHHAVQDYAFMRTLPNMRICAPGDPNEVRKCLDYISSSPGPSYLRLGKAGESIYTPSEGNLQLATPIPVNKNKSADIAVITTGCALQVVAPWLEKNSRKNKIDLYTLPVWGMADDLAWPFNCLNYKKIITVEDHLASAGFGSWLLEILDNVDRTKLQVLALDSAVCGMVGSQKFLNNAGGLHERNFEAALAA